MGCELGFVGGKLVVVGKTQHSRSWSSKRRVVTMVEARPKPRTGMPIKLKKPSKVNLTNFPTLDEEGERFERQGKRMARDGLYVEFNYDFDSKTGFDWFKELSRKVFNDAFRASGREFLRYDPEQLAKFYNGQPLAVLGRISKVIIPFSWWFTDYMITRLTSSSGEGQISDEASARLARRLKGTLVIMGPTFVKIGQALSQRPDLVGPAFCDELKKLQDNVATFPTENAIKILEAEYNRPLNEIYDFISPEPVAAASLGQVYKAHVIGAPANDFAAVKVQRPSIGTDAAIDLYLTRKLARIAKKVFGLRTNLVAVNDEFALRLFEETNYVQEARNCERFRSLYSDIQGIFIPRAYPQLTTRYVLCMEWVEGTKSPWGEDAIRLIDVGIQCTLRQLLDAGFFHADPHPGNLMRTSDGRLAYLDFGMMSEVEPQKRYDLIGSVMHLINKDYNLLTGDLIKLDFLPPDADVEAIAPLLEEAFTKASGDGESMANLSFNKLATHMAGVAFKSPIRLPPYYSLIIRSLTILEGIALTENKDFKIVDESFPYVSKRILMDSDPELRARLREVLVDPETGRLRWSRLKNLVREGESRSDEIVPGSSPGSKRPDDVSIVEKMVEYVLSEEGSFLRDALVEDLVDAVDSAQLAMQDSVSKFSGGLVPKPVDQPDRELLANVQMIMRMLGGEIRKGQRNSTYRRAQNFASASVNGASSVFLNASSIQDEAGKALRLVMGSLVERNSTRAFRTVLSLVEGAIDKQVEQAQKKQKPF